KEPASVTASANSLYSAAADGQAVIACARHLQNLSPAVSGVAQSGADSISAAVQISSIDWSNAGAQVFVPITNRALLSYDGCGNQVENLTVSASSGDAAGLFGVFGDGGHPASITDVRLADVQVDAGSARYAGALTGLAQNVSFSGCRAWARPQLLDELSDCGVISAVSNGVGQSVGGLVGRMEGGSAARCFASLGSFDVSARDSSSSLAAGGFVGSADEDAVLEECYADSYLFSVTASGPQAFAGGFAGSLAGRAESCYALGTLSLSGNVGGGGFAGQVEGSVESAYSAAVFTLPGAESVAASFVLDAGEDAGFRACRFLSDTGWTQALPAAASESSAAQIGSAYVADVWSAASEATSFPYTVEDVFPFPRLTAMPHFGDWPLASVEPITPDAPWIVYYELYRLSDQSYQLGLYNRDLSIGESEDYLDTLLEDEDFDALVQDGYLMLFPKDNGAESSFGIDYNDLANDSTNYTYQKWSRNSKDVTQNWSKCPGDLRDSSVNVVAKGLVYDDGEEAWDIRNGVAIGIDGQEYYPIFLANAHVADDSNKAPGFYQKLTVGLNPNGSGTTGASEFEYYYNPHFAKSKISVGSPISEAAPVAIIRTERHFATLATNTYQKYWKNSALTIRQERDLNFLENPYTTVYFYGTNLSASWYKELAPLGTSVDQYFSAIYDGNNHSILGLRYSASSRSNIGMFGYIKGGTVKDLTLISPSVNSNQQTTTNTAAGALVGYLVEGTIDNVTLQDPTVKTHHVAGLAAGVVANGSKIRGLTVAGGSLDVARIGGGAIGQLTTISGSTTATTVIDGVTVSGASVHSGSLPTGLSAVNGGNFGTSAFVGGLIHSANVAATTVIQNVTVDGCTVTVDGADGAPENSAEISGLLIGSMHSTQKNPTLSFGEGIAISDSTLKANGSGLSDAYGASVGQVSSTASYTLPLPVVTFENCVIDRTEAEEATDTSIGLIVGRITTDSGKPFTVTLPKRFSSNGVSVSYSASRLQSHVGGLAGTVSAQTIVQGASGGTFFTPGRGLNGDGGNLGGFAGLLDNVVVSGVSVTDPLFAEGSDAQYAGGFAGALRSGAFVDHCDVRRSSAGADAGIFSSGIAGGFVGCHAGSSKIDSCFAAVDVESDSYAGGFVGLSESGRILRSYASGEAFGHLSGGFAGVIGTGTALPSISNCYATGDAAAVSTGFSGAFVGAIESGFVANNYSLGGISGTDNAGKGIGGFIGKFDEDSATESNEISLLQEFYDLVSSTKVTNRLNAGTGNLPYYERDENGALILDSSGEPILNTDLCLTIPQYLKLLNMTMDSTAYISDFVVQRDENGAPLNSNAPAVNEIFASIKSSASPELTAFLAARDWGLNWDQETSTMVLYWTGGLLSNSLLNEPEIVFRGDFSRGEYAVGSAVIVTRTALGKTFRAMDFSTWTPNAEIGFGGSTLVTFGNRYLYSASNSYNTEYTDHLLENAGIKRWTVPEFAIEAQAQNLFLDMTAVQQWFPYNSRLTNFSYPSAGNAGAGFDLSTHYGDWPELPAPEVPALSANDYNNGNRRLGVFRYEQIDGNAYRLIDSAIDYTYAGGGTVGSKISSFTSSTKLFDMEVNLTDYLSTHTLPNAQEGLGVFWYSMMTQNPVASRQETGYLQVNGANLSGVFAGDYSGDLGISSDYIMIPLAVSASPVTFDLRWNNGNSDANMNANFTWDGDAFTVNAWTGKR
ncbi:MAG: hypothetical protein PHD67_06655, partial [Oscillospiraceae bacterium]|nr:hypothetical protein [Oscillospiraceae bacterium]